MKQGDSVLALQQYTTTSESPKILSKKRGAGHLKSSPCTQMERGARGLAGTGAGMLTLECTRRITSPSAVRPDAASAAPRSSAGWGPYAGEQHFTTPSTTVS